MSSLVMLELSREFTLSLEFIKQKSSFISRRQERLLNLIAKVLSSTSKSKFLERAIRSSNKV